MADLQTKITTMLPEDLHELAAQFTIPEEYFDKDIEIVILILRSKSIDTVDEKQNWFNLLSMMNTDQVEKLRGILLKEKAKLDEIEEKYEKRKSEIRDKYLNKREDAGYIKKVDAIKEKESEVEQQDKQDAEDLLSAL